MRWRHVPCPIYCRCVQRSPPAGRPTGYWPAQCFNVSSSDFATLPRKAA